MRGYAVPKVYRSFEEFERDELRKLDGIHLSIDEMLDEMFPTAAPGTTNGTTNDDKKASAP